MRWRRHGSQRDSQGRGPAVLSNPRNSGASAPPPPTPRPGGRGFRWIRGRRFIEGSSYVSPKDATADQFLDFQHYIVRRILGGNHQSPLRQPRMILDAGCGTGRWVVEMATEFPGARVVGLDLVMPSNAAPMLAALGRLAANVTFVEGDLLKRLPFATATFDFVHMRLMFDDLPAARMPQIVRELVRVTRPGGWVELAEPAEAVYDPGPAYQRLTEWTAEMCRRRGLDPNMGPKLKSLLQSAGLAQVSERRVVSFPDLRLTRERRLWQAQAIGAYESIFRDVLISAGIVSAPEFDRTLQEARIEFEQGRHANSDVLHVAYGQRT